MAKALEPCPPDVGELSTAVASVWGAGFTGRGFTQVKSQFQTLNLIQLEERWFGWGMYRTEPVPLQPESSLRESTPRHQNSPAHISTTRNSTTSHGAVQRRCINQWS